ncbi:FliM/FliN family flagellar motor switch protein [Pseudoduganella namucuonensis]|uniref:Flagellar motor switch protein FliM n=1 Tax=Pseudoduganella namucuonensis TaxID=1035707 RepID=A0A1I7HTR6_9BURK|nr:FliM/FliN family flagellar motor switch protein [Pseudoduganella namucuonensis]SFU63959.1 flagellar motor switch protein FliM [Pseudoduganella namucuonensis]
MTIIKQTAQHQVLDPCLLGRPVHRLPRFAAQLQEDLSQAMRLNVNRRYWGTFQVEGVEFSRLDGGEPRLRWLSFAAPAGSIGFALERKVLLSVLNFRYGRAKSDSAVDDSAVKITATEERLAVVLGQQLAGTLAARIEANLPATAKLPAGEDMQPVPAAQPKKGAWVVAVTVSDPESAGATPLSGRFWFALDQQLMTCVLRGLAPERDVARRAMYDLAPLAARLPVRLDGRLVTKEMQLGTLFDLQIGDVIPISMHRADVLLDDSRLFTAAVSEHKGKICLTSFEDVE